MFLSRWKTRILLEVLLSLSLSKSENKILLAKWPLLSIWYLTCLWNWRVIYHCQLQDSLKGTFMQTYSRPLPLWDVAISLHIEEERGFVYAQKLARPTAPCYNNEWLVRSISRGYPSTSLHQADPAYFNCPSASFSKYGFF